MSHRVPKVTQLQPRRDLRSLRLHSPEPPLEAAACVCEEGTHCDPDRPALSHLLPSLTRSVRERCLEEQKRRRQRATKKISTFIGTFLVCFAPYVITR